MSNTATMARAADRFQLASMRANFLSKCSMDAFRSFTGGLRARAGLMGVAGALFACVSGKSCCVCVQHLSTPFVQTIKSTNLSI
jgi:hypothetical protein